MKRIIFPIFIAAFLITCGCSRVSLVASYYLIDYRPHPDNPRLMLEKPIPHKAQVLKFKIPRTFDSIRIIARFSSHQINYYRYSLWAVRPQVAVSDLLVQHINAYQLFQQCRQEYLEERPDYEISGELFQIERFESEQYSAAHLKMSFGMSDYDSGDILVRHEFDREIPIPPGEMTIFAKAISDMLSEETEYFLEKIVDHFYPPEESENGIAE